MNSFKAEIVESKNFFIQKNLFFKFGSLILGIAAAIYLFLLQDVYPNIYLSIGSFIIYLYGFYILIYQSFVRPKAVGSLVLTDSYLNFNYKNKEKKLDFSSIKNLNLIYTGYGSWRQYIWGHKNYLEIRSNNENDTKFEFRIKNKKQKNKMKNMLNSKALREHFELQKTKNSKLKF
jgi:hypothetical protein